MGTHLWSLKSNLQNRHKKCSKWEPSKILPRRPSRGCPRHSPKSELATPSLPPPALSPRLSRKSRPSSPDASTSKRPANTLPSTPPRPPLWSPRRRPPRPTVTFTCPMSPSWLWPFVSVVSTRSRQSPKRSSSFCDFDKSATAFLSDSTRPVSRCSALPTHSSPGATQPKIPSRSWCTSEVLSNITASESRSPRTALLRRVWDLGLNCIEDLVHEIHTVGDNFKEANNCLYPVKLSCPRGGWRKITNHFIEGGDFGNREEYINQLAMKMN